MQKTACVYVCPECRGALQSVGCQYGSGWGGDACELTACRSSCLILRRSPHCMFSSGGEPLEDSDQEQLRMWACRGVTTCAPSDVSVAMGR